MTHLRYLRSCIFSFDYSVTRPSFTFSTVTFARTCELSHSLLSRSYCTPSRPLRHCWSCNSTVEWRAFFCKCGKIQPLEVQLSYFDVFGYPDPVARISSADLAVRMRKVQKELHPDKFTRTTQDEQKLASEASTFVNQAYATLERPLDRFEYILSLHGFGGDLPIATSCTSDSSILTEVLEINEAIEHIVEILTSDDKVHDISRLRASISEVVAHIVSNLSREEDALVQHIESSRWKEAHQSLVRYRYYCRSLEQIREHELAWKKLGVDVDIPSGHH